jgi:hypothetical protein
MLLPWLKIACRCLRVFLLGCLTRRVLLMKAALVVHHVSWILLRFLVPAFAKAEPRQDST